MWLALLLYQKISYKIYKYLKTRKEVVNIFKEEIKQNAKAVIPIAVLVMILNLFRPVENELIIKFLFGCAGVILGLSIFLIGVDLSISKIGSYMGIL